MKLKIFEVILYLIIFYFSIFFNYYFIILLFLQFIFFYFCKKQVLSINLKSGSLKNKTLQLLIGNISHELNSPLFLIENELKEILFFEKNQKTKEKISLILENLNIIKNIVEKFADYRETKLSNGNKSLYDVIFISKEIIEIVLKRKCNIIISDDFKNYSLKNLSNEDFMNIFINLFKNSIEANATDIYLTLSKIDENKIKIIYKDNGKGIPKKIQKKLFNTFISEKGDYRGFGSIFIKQILNEGKGDIYLKFSKEGYGTIFEIIVNVIKKEKK